MNTTYINYYFYKHSILYKSILNDIIMYKFEYNNNHDIYNNGYLDKDYDEKLYGNFDNRYLDLNFDEKLYGNFDDFEDYWDSVYN